MNIIDVITIGLLGYIAIAVTVSTNQIDVYIQAKKKSGQNDH